MSAHETTVLWARQSEGFSYEEYNREHEWLTGSGQRIKASAAPAFLGDGGSVDPEEAFVASVSACHMLTFLAICARRRITVNTYRDTAKGWLKKNDEGRLAVTRVELCPEIEFQGDPPPEERLAWLHEQSHKECFIANSVTTEIVVVERR